VAKENEGRVQQVGSGQQRTRVQQAMNNRKKGGRCRSIASSGEGRQGAHGRSGLGIIATADEDGPHRSSGSVTSTVDVEVAPITRSPECKAGDVGDPQGGDDTSALDK